MTCKLIEILKCARITIIIIIIIIIIKWRCFRSFNPYAHICHKYSAIVDLHPDLSYETNLAINSAQK